MYSRRFLRSYMGSSVVVVDSGGAGDVQTPAAATGLVQDGDGIVIMPGSYSCPLLDIPHGVSLIGVGGPMATILTADGTLVDQSTNNPLILLRGDNVVSGFDISRSDATNNYGPSIDIRASGNVWIHHNRFGRANDVIASADSGALIHVLIENNEFYAPSWDVITPNQLAAGSTWRIYHNTFRGSPSIAFASTSFMINAVTTAAAMRMECMYNDVRLVVSDADVTDVGWMKIPQSTSAQHVFVSAYNRIHIDCTTDNQEVTGYSMLRQTSRYTADLTIIDDHLTLLSGGTISPMKVQTGSLFPTYRGSVNVHGTYISSIQSNFNTANYPLYSSYGPALDRVNALTDAATITIDPAKGDIQTISGITTNRALAAAASLGTYRTGQRVKLIITDDGGAADTITPDGTTIKGEVITLTASADVSTVVNYVYNGTYWMQDGSVAVSGGVTEVGY